MYQKTTAELSTLGAEITTREIKQEPQLWKEAFENYLAKKSEIEAFLSNVKKSTDDKVEVIFTGAGSSAYVGDTAAPFLTETGDRGSYIFSAVDTTKIVSTPRQYLDPDATIILVSFARSGNSPESVAAVEIAKKIVKNLWQLTITCAPEGKLAINAQGDDRNLVLMQPALSNDKGFAMTGSFSCMLLTSMLVFDEESSSDQKSSYVNSIAAMGDEVITREAEIQTIVDTDFDRIIYLGSGALGGLTREAQLKVLELTAGAKATMFDTSMGFRHGPKSFVNNKTLLFDFLSNDKYTRQYDIDILDEVKHDAIAPVVMGLGVDSTQNFAGSNFEFKQGTDAIPDGYMALPDIIFAQTIALFTSIKVGNTPDTPSATGTVNRVVKGVTIHEY